MSKQTSLCYIEQDGCCLMLHRIKKEHDENAGKWIGIGGKFEQDESPEDCVLREVREETGLTLEEYRYRGLVTFVFDDGKTHLCEYMHLFTATGFSGTLTDCDEGVLEWLPKEQLLALPMWAGDRIFLELLERRQRFFSLKLQYGGENLTGAVLDGVPLSEEVLRGGQIPAELTE